MAGKLTDTEIRFAKANGNKRLVLRDGGGLELNVNPDGTRVWYVRARIRGSGIQRRVRLGNYSPALKQNGTSIHPL